MSIRYYLLLLAGVITTLVTVGSFFIDNMILRDNMIKARREIIHLFKDLYDQKRDSLEEFIATLLAKNLAQVNATLEAISKFDTLMDWFAYTEENVQRGTWNNAANLIQQDEWIGFLQNTAGSELLSMIIPARGPFFSTQAYPIQEGLAWVYLVNAPAYAEPFLGIQVPIRIIHAAEEEVGPTLDAKILPVVYILYEPSRFHALHFPMEKKDFPPLFAQVPFAGGIEVDEERFLQYLTSATELIRNPKLQIPSDKEEGFQLSAATSQQEGFSGKLEQYFHERISYANELFLIWQASVLREMGIFGEKGGVNNWPKAMSFSSGSLNKSQAFFVDLVMNFDKPIFDDVSFFVHNQPKKQEDFVSSGAYVVKSPHSNQAFLVNTANIYKMEGQENKQSLLSLGIDLNPILDNLISSMQQYGCIFSQGEIMVNGAPGGKTTISKEILQPVLSGVIDKLNGMIDIAGISYYFSRMQPDPNVDLHFFLFDPKREEFSFLYDFQDRVREILKTVEINRNVLEVFTVLLLWVLLLNVSKKITSPILALSSALTHVKKGHWDQIQMPKLKFRKNNEIRQLFDSFQDMVEGMKEKEKITGILNKVVSEEIAEEILKNDVKLGGEERVVTMLFADIRGFTKLTQNMPPHEVIGFLNKCMTKLSTAVEDNKGVIDKYMGDGLMALFGAPIEYENSPLHGIIAGLEMIQLLKEWNQEREKDGLESIHIGIGVHTGSVFTGNMGAQNRLNYTVIGSHVNLASRLCSSAQQEELLITEDTYLQPCIRENVEVEDKGMMAFKGFDEQKQVFKVLSLKYKVKA